METRIVQAKITNKEGRIVRLMYDIITAYELLDALEIESGIYNNIFILIFILFSLFETVMR
jgi:hypothetical protein